MSKQSYAIDLLALSTAYKDYRRLQNDKQHAVMLSKPLLKLHQQNSRLTVFFKMLNSLLQLPFLTITTNRDSSIKRASFTLFIMLYLQLPQQIIR